MSIITKRINYRDMQSLVRAWRERTALSGNQLRFNHIDCPAGVDTRQRLYVKHDAINNKWLAFCHNCGSAGVYQEKTNGVLPVPVYPDREPYLRLDVPIIPAKPEPSYLWAACEKSYADHLNYHFPYTPGAPCETCCERNPFKDTFKNEWLEKYGARAWYFGHVIDSIPADTTSLVLPASFSEEGKPRVYSIKTKKDAGSSYPKWMHLSKLGGRIGPIIDNPGKDMVVIVEDRISAIAIVEATMGGVSACTLSGTNILGEDIFKLSMCFKKVFVWLDNDSNDVKIKSQDMVRSFLLLNVPCIDTELPDPKGFSASIIAERIAKAEIQLDSNYPKF